MLLKTMLLSTLALAHPIACDTQNPDTPKYVLNAIFPGQGAAGMQPLQVRRDSIVYGLTQGYSYFQLEAIGDNLVNVLAPGQPPKELYAGDSGELVINEHPGELGKGYDGGWGFQGDGTIKDVTYYGDRDWYSCTSKTDPLHGGQVVHIKQGDKYACEDPIKFTVVATKE